MQLQNEKQRLIVARTQLETSLFGAGAAARASIRTARCELADQVSFFDTPAVSADQTLETAYAARPELRQIAVAASSAPRSNCAPPAMQRLPKLSVSGFWAEQGLTPASVIPVYQYQASLDVPLFTGGRIQAERAKADLAIRQFKQQEQDVRNRIALEVKTAVAQVDARAQRSGRSRTWASQLARQEVEQARDRFQAGVANNIEVITAQDALSRASDNQIAALYRYNQSRADLAHATGQMEALYADKLRSPHRHGINPWIIAMTVMLATFMEVLDTSVANVALPHIAGSLSASVDESTWVLTSYLVANAIILPMGGWFSMLFGRKRFYMTCVALFTREFAVSAAWRRTLRHADLVPRAAGHRRRRAAADLAGHPGGELSRAKSRAWRWRSTAWAWWWRP